jgi:hypothetical protein
VFRRRRRFLEVKRRRQAQESAARVCSVPIEPSLLSTSRVRSARRCAPLAAALFLACAAPVHAQGDVLRDIIISNTSLEGFTFRVTYYSPQGQAWGIGDHLISIHRATITQGTITVRVELSANAEARVAQGPNSIQGISIGYGNNIFVSDYGPPHESLAVEYSIPWDTTKFPTFVKFDIDILGIGARCGDVLGGVWSGCGIRRKIVILPATAAITIDGLDRPRPIVLYRGPSLTNRDVRSMGLSPFAEWKSLALDGVTLQKVGFIDGFGTPSPGTWYRYPVRQGDQLPASDPRRGDPLRPTDVGIGPPDFDSNNELDNFLGCSASGCGYHAARFGLPADLPTGLHTVTLTTGPYAIGFAKWYGADINVNGGGAASQQLSVNFILYGPLAELSTSQAQPGEKIIVRGSGFAPNSMVRFQAEISSRGAPVPLGMPVATDITGSFQADMILPPPGHAFYADLVERGQLPGAIRVYVDDPAFIAYYFNGAPQSDHADITFLAPGTVTTTTLPPGNECVTDDPCVDLDPCTDDRCVNGRCSNTPRTGVAAVICTSPPGGLSQPEYTEEVPQSAVKQYDKGDDLLELAAAFGAEDLARKAVRKKVKKLVKKAIKKFDKAERVVLLAADNDIISEEFADALVGVIREVSDQARDFLETF